MPEKQLTFLQGIEDDRLYSLTRWKALTCHSDYDRFEMDNNAAVRALRGVASGRSNYRFMGSEAGGERAA